MKVTVISTGYVGLTTGTALAFLGHHVTCVDKNERIVERLRAGEVTIHEHGLPEMLRAVRHRLSFTDEILPLKGPGVAIISGGTSPGIDAVILSIRSRGTAETWIKHAGSRVFSTGAPLELCRYVRYVRSGEVQLRY